MNFIRDNIVKLGAILVIAIIIIVVAVACSGGGGVQVEDSSGYVEMENTLQNAAIKYVKKNQSLLPKTTEKTRKIQLDTLINNKMIGELSAIEDSNVKCRGYVEIIKKYENKAEYRYTPYIKCGKYYETKTIGEYITSNEAIVSSGEGLYNLGESYVFKGEYPNNYILLGERMYRILEITEDNNLKVISTTPTDTYFVWDNRYNSEKEDYYGINDFEKSRLKESLINLYENTDEDKGEVFFSDVEREYIIEHDFCIGKRSSNDVSINSESECFVKTPLKVGVISLNEYYRTSIDSGCNAINKNECNNYNFLFSIQGDRTPRFMTLIASSDNSYNFYRINSGELELKYTYVENSIFPVIYLDSNIIYKSGNGTSENPYIVR